MRIKNLIEKTPLAKIFRKLKHEVNFAKKMFSNTPFGFKFSGYESMQDGNFESTEVHLIQQHLKSADILIDVGANFGYYTCLGCAMKVKVVAFEPLPENLDYLFANLKANSWENDVEVFPLGLADKSGLADFFGASTGASLLSGWAGVSDCFKRTIALSTLDTILQSRFNNKKVVIKIDVEGAEFKVLCGASRLLTQDPKPVWLVEITLDEHRSKGQPNPDFLKTFELFWENGYEAFEVSTQRRLLSRSQIEDYFYSRTRPDWEIGNYLFISGK